MSWYPFKGKVQGLLLILAMPSLANASDITIKHWQTQRGSQVAFVRNHQLPMLDIQLDFAAGSAFDGNRWGLAALTLGSLDQGAGGKDASAVAEWFEDEGAQLSTSLDRDKATLKVRTLTSPEALNATLAGLSTILHQPDFKVKDVERVKHQQLSTITYRMGQPASVATDGFYHLFYGEHPYGHPIDGTADKVKRLSFVDTKGFYQRFYQPQRMVISMVGDISRAQAKRIAERLSNALPKPTSVNRMTIPLFKQTQAEPDNHLSFSTSQTAIRLGQRGILYDNPQYYPLQVGNYTLGGGGLVSRLMTEVRERRGLTYGIYTRFDMLQGLGPYTISMSTKQESGEQALTVTQKTLASFLKNGPNEEELARAKQYLTGSFPLKLASNHDILSAVAAIAYYKLPWDFLQRYPEHIESVTQEQVKTAYKQLQQHNPWITVTVGQDG